MSSLAIIPTINKSRLLPLLIDTLVAEGVEVVIVDGSDDEQLPLQEGVQRLYYKWNIYRVWNYGIYLGRLRDHKCVLVLNDDVLIEPGAVKLMETALEKSQFGVLSFELPSRSEHLALLSGRNDLSISDTTEDARWKGAHNIAGPAFAVNPHIVKYTDEHYKWFCGDDDLFYQTALEGGRIGVLHGATAHHPHESTSSDGGNKAVLNALFGEGWEEHDRERLAIKFRAWDQYGEWRTE